MWKIFLCLLLFIFTSCHLPLNPVSSVGKKPFFDVNENKFIIWSSDNFKWISEKSINGELTNDIILQQDISMDGEYFDGFGEFTNTFDGNGFSIKNFTIYKPNEDDVGLVKILNGGIIKNLILDNIEIVGRTNVGSIVGRNPQGALLINCHVLNSKVSGKYSVGGIVGYTSTNSTIESSSFVSGKISGDNPVGGIVGYAAEDAVIKYCYNNSVVIGTNTVAGIVGVSEQNVVIENVYNSGDVISLAPSSAISGGIVAYSSYNTTISNCYNTGVIKAANFAGGIIGISQSTIIENCYNIGNIICSNANQSGAIAGSDGGSTVFVNNYYLDSSSAYAVGTHASVIGRLRQNDFADTSNFPGFDFTAIWYMGRGLKKVSVRPCFVNLRE